MASLPTTVPTAAPPAGPAPAPPPPAPAPSPPRPSPSAPAGPPPPAASAPAASTPPAAPSQAPPAASTAPQPPAATATATAAVPTAVVVTPTASAPLVTAVIPTTAPVPTLTSIRPIVAVTTPLTSFKPIIATSNGEIVTITSVIGSPSDAASVNSSPPPKSFFENKGAVAAVFSIAGIVGFAAIIALLTNAIRRRRAKRFDRDVAEAAAEAAASSARTPPFLDDDPFHDYHGTVPGAGAAAGYNSGGYGQSQMQSYGSVYDNGGVAGVGASELARSRSMGWHGAYPAYGMPPPPQQYAQQQQQEMYDPRYHNGPGYAEYEAFDGSTVNAAAQPQQSSPHTTPGKHKSLSLESGSAVGLFANGAAGAGNGHASNGYESYASRYQPTNGTTLPTTYASTAPYPRHSTSLDGHHPYYTATPPPGNDFLYGGNRISTQSMLMNPHRQSSLPLGHQAGGSDEASLYDGDPYGGIGNPSMRDLNGEDEKRVLKVANE